MSVERLFFVAIPQLLETIHELLIGSSQCLLFGPKFHFVTLIFENNKFLSLENHKGKAFLGESTESWKLSNVQIHTNYVERFVVTLSSPIFQIEFSFNRLNINRGKSRRPLGHRFWRRRRVVVAVLAPLSITLCGDFCRLEHCSLRILAAQRRSTDMKVIVFISRFAIDSPNLRVTHDLAQAVVVNRIAEVLVLESHVLFARS